MLWVPRKGKLRIQTNAEATGAVPGLQLNNDTVAVTTKGTVTELIAATSFDVCWITLTFLGGSTAAADNRFMVDLLLGAATERVAIADMIAHGAANRGVGRRFDFPLYIPAGTRIAARSAGTLSRNVQCQIWCYGGLISPPWRVAQKVTTYGATVPDGTAITPGASGAQGAWTQITAGTSEAHWGFVPSFGIGNDSTINNRWLRVELGHGAATEESMEFDYWYGHNSSEEQSGSLSTMPCLCDQPSGTRLVMRASNEGTNDTAYQGIIHALS
jgi:hypothetical protein